MNFEFGTHLANKKEKASETMPFPFCKSLILCSFARSAASGTYSRPAASFAVALIAGEHRYANVNPRPAALITFAVALGLAIARSVAFSTRFCHDWFPLNIKEV